MGLSLDGKSEGMEFKKVEWKEGQEGRNLLWDKSIVPIFVKIEASEHCCAHNEIFNPNKILNSVFGPS